MIQLRDYQQDLFERAQQSFRAGNKHPLIQLVTGGGKSALLAKICQGSIDKGTPTMAVAHRRELISQLSCALAKFGVKHCIVATPDVIAEIRRLHIADFGWPMIDQNSPVMVASVQTLVRRFDKLPHEPKLIITDEGHHLTEGSTWAKVHERFPRAYGLLLTATPCRLDGKGLGKGQGGYADDIILGPPMRELIDRGFLSDYRLFGPPSAIAMTGVKTKFGDYAKEDLAVAMDKPSITGDVVSHYKELAADKLGVAFCVSVAHAEHVAESFRAAGITSLAVHGTLDGAERRKRLKDFADRKIMVITAADIISEGVDIVGIECAMLLRPTQSLSLYLQQIGRALRPAPGKETAIVLDHAANFSRHGLPDSDFGWSLDGRKKSKAEKEAQEKPVAALQCPKCQFIDYPRKICGAPKIAGGTCDHVFEIKSRKLEQVDGTLQEVIAADRPSPIKTGMISSAEQAKAAGMPLGQWHQIERARIEKDALRTDLRDTLMAWAQSTGRGIRDGWGFNMGDIRDMKPKALKQNIQRAKLAVELERVLANLPLRPDPGAFTDLTAEQIQSLIDQACDGLFHSKEISNGN